MSLLKGFSIFFMYPEPDAWEKISTNYSSKDQNNNNFTGKSGNFGKSLVQHSINIKHFTKH